MKMTSKLIRVLYPISSLRPSAAERAIATSSMATEMIKGRKLEDALKLTNKAVVEALEGLPPAKIHCSVLAEQAIKAAISDYYKRRGVDPVPLVGEIGECHACEI